MIPTKPRRIKTLKLSKNLERLYKQTKCRDCSVMVTRMDFAKILGKFTKVKIQFETTNTPKSKRIVSSPVSRLKGNENGTVPLHRSAYNPHPAKKLLGLGKRTKNDDTPRQSPNILKENNRIKKMVSKNREYNAAKSNHTHVKYYKIVFANPINKKVEVKSKINLDNLLPSIDDNVLPSEEWCIDYFPKKGEPKDDKIYDRIAAELEDLMYSEKTKSDGDKKEGKSDEFPSILDILNDTAKSETDKSNTQPSVSLESSDVEAMLLGKPNPSESTPMEVDKPNTTDAAESNPEGNDTKPSALDDNPASPSILEEPEQPEVPVLSVADKPLIISPSQEPQSNTSYGDENDNINAKNKNNLKAGVTQVIFKKTINGTSSKTVICPKNLKYSISIDGKSTELLGAPKVITSLEDLKVLLQIVEESELTSLYLLQ